MVNIHKRHLCDTGSIPVVLVALNEMLEHCIRYMAHKCKENTLL